MPEPRYTSAWRGSRGELYFRPLVLNPRQPADRFEGYTMSEFRASVSNPDIFPLPIELIEAAETVNGNQPLDPFS